MDVFASVLQSAAPLILAAMAGLLSQRTGIWHLGLGGLMSIGAMVSVVVAKETSNVTLAVVLAVTASMAMSIVMWAVIVGLRANPIIVGIGVNALGAGGTILGIVALYGKEGTVYSDVVLPRPLSFLDGAPGRLSIIAILTPFIVAAVWFVVCRTRFGLRLTAVGDHPFAARSSGVSLPRARLWGLGLGGVLAGLAGVELALGPLGSFSSGMEAGRGLMAFAAVILGATHPIVVALAATFFGAVTYFGIWAQINMVGVIDTNLMLMLPYVVVIVAVVITASVRGSAKSANLSELREG